MSYNIKCDQCGTKISTSIEMIGFQMQCSTCGSEVIVPLTNFTAGMVSGNYWIQKSMGAGNISETFIAKRMSDNEKVFLKILSPCVTTVHENVEQFMIEMCRSHQIDHPSLISVYETGKMNGHYYLATRYVEGECLDKRIEHSGPLSEKEALRLCLKIARVLRSCWHDFGIVHRAIKPSNILVNDAGEVFLLDVGNCKQLLISDQVPLERMDNLGTLADFMSPEEAQGVLEVDCSSDIYSLGATLFYLMTGTTPYSGSDTTQVLLKHLNAPTPSINQRSDEVSRETAKFIRSMMDTNPENRIYSWREVVGKLKQLLKTKTRGSITDKVLKTHVGVKSDTDESLQSAIIPPPQQQANSALKFVAIAMAIILLLGIIGVIAIIASQGNDTPTQTQTQAPPIKPKGSGQASSSTVTTASTDFDNKFKALVDWYKNYPAKKATISKRLTALRSEATTPLQKALCKNLEDVLNGKRSADDVYDTNTTGSVRPTPIINEPKTPVKTPPSEELLKVDTASFKLGDKEIPFKNKGFDDGIMAPWLNKSLGGGSAKVSQGGTQSGKYALQLTPGGRSSYVFSAPKGKDFGGKTVTFQAYAKIKNSRPGYLDIAMYNKSGGQLDMKSTTIAGKSFIPYKVTAKVPAGCTKIVIRCRY